MEIIATILVEAFIMMVLVIPGVFVRWVFLKGKSFQEVWNMDKFVSSAVGLVFVAFVWLMLIVFMQLYST